MHVKEGDRKEAKRLVAEGIDIIRQLERQRALTPDVQETLNKLNEIANALGLSSGSEGWQLLKTPFLVLGSKVLTGY